MFERIVVEHGELTGGGDIGHRRTAGGTQASGVAFAAALGEVTRDGRQKAARRAASLSQQHVRLGA
jgi:hypothetical protein